MIPVIGLSLLEAAGVGPVAVSAGARAGDLLAHGGPVPPVHDGGLQVRPVATLKVALAST